MTASAFLLLVYLASAMLAGVALGATGTVLYILRHFRLHAFEDK